MSKPGKLNVIARKGDRKLLTITFVDSNGDAYDVSGWTSPTLTLYTHVGSAAALTSTSEISVATNVMTIDFDSAADDYSALEARDYRYELNAVTAGTVPITILTGQWRLKGIGSDPETESTATITVDISGTSVSVTAGGTTATMQGLSNVTITSVASGELLKYNGTIWINTTLSEADLLALSNNLSDLSNATTARGNLGLAIGTDVQAYDAGLADVASLATTNGNVIVGDGTNWVAESGATARTSLGLGTIATQAADSVNIDGGAIDGVAIGASSPSTGSFTTLIGTDILFQPAESGAASFNPYNNKGTHLSVITMNASTNKYGPYVALGSRDANFSTRNPKYLAAMVGYASEGYAADTDSGMGLSFFVTPDDAGADPSPVESMVLNQNGDLKLSGNENGVETFDIYGTGVHLSRYIMSGTLKYGNFIAFGSTDNSFVTKNPKYLAAIVSRSSEGYAADTDSGMALEIFTTPDNAGASPTPSLRMTIDQDGDVGIGVGATLADISARLHLISTTEQFRSGYDAGSYWSATTVDTTGITTFAAVGSAPGFAITGFVQLGNVTLAAAAANSFKIGSVDLSGGNTMLAMYGEGTCIGAGTPAADTTIAVEVNGTTYYILASTAAS